jgi:CRP/FNR family cyclic AMP-dependent transcriptional regulator
MEFLVDKVFSLKSVSIFESLAEASLLDVARIMSFEEFKEGDIFIKKGDVANDMYIIKDGKVAVMDGDAVLATLGENEIVGELAILAPIRRTASVKALTDVLLYKIEREYFLDLLYEKPEMMGDLIEILIGRIMFLNSELKKYQLLLKSKGL